MLKWPLKKEGFIYLDYKEPKLLFNVCNFGFVKVESQINLNNFVKQHRLINPTSSLKKIVSKSADRASPSRLGDLILFLAILNNLNKNTKYLT